MDLTTKLNEYQNLLDKTKVSGDRSSNLNIMDHDKPAPLIHDQGESEQPLGTRSCGLSTEEALLSLHEDMNTEISKMRDEVSKRRFLESLKESISFGSELSKMRWPSVLFMATQAIAHFIVEFILDVDNPATNWVGFQGFILLALLLLSLGLNLWDTRLRLSELLMKSEGISNLIKRCAEDKALLRHWQGEQSSSAKTKTLFIPKSPSIHQTLTYRDNFCLNLPDYLLVKGDIIHLYPGDPSPADCVSLLDLQKTIQNDDGGDGKYHQAKINLSMGQIFQDPTNKEENINLVSGQIASPSEPTKFDVKEAQQLKKDKLLMQFNHAKMKRAHRGADFLVLATPYIKSLRMSLQRSHQRPVNSVEKECFIISRKYFETFVIPMVFSLSTLMTAIHYGYLDFADSEHKIKTISIAYLLLRPSLTIMPFLPWMFPFFWMSVNAFGSARLLCCAEAQRKKGRLSSTAKLSPSDSRRPSETQYLQRVENLLATPNTHGGSETTRTEEGDLQDLRANIRFMDVFKMFIDLIHGRSGHVWRSSSLLQVLGCLTSLSCVDKVGILSWPNPSPEKVFILTEDEQASQNDQQVRTTVSSGVGLSSQPVTNSGPKTSDGVDQISLKGSNKTLYDEPIAELDSKNDKYRDVQLAKYRFRHEILDVSQNLSFSGDYQHGKTSHVIFPQQQQHGLQFDDPLWNKYSSNLKPLGLAIMLNNCCESSFADYFKFYKHISYESMQRCDLTPVVKRRCICDLAKLIGFTRQEVEKNYKFERQLGIYKLIDCIPLNNRGKQLASSLGVGLDSNNQLKLPFPNMTCNLHQDSTTGSRQMFTQGTADIVLNSCIEFWDGRQLVPLDDLSRKKIMDFYQRTSLTSYCSAFCYAPSMSAKQHQLGANYFIELSPEYSRFAPSLRRLVSEYQDEFLRNQLFSLPRHQADELMATESQSEFHNMSYSSDDDADDNELQAKKITRPKTRRHLSAEDLSEPLCQDARDKQMSKSNKSETFDEMLEELTDQVFVGMVSMQYQACTDFVALIEQLEHACIRFIHFSKENELRSRVFSEKMGLEAGWNCHVSLQSDQVAESPRNVPAKATKAADIARLVNQQNVPDASPTKMHSKQADEFSLNSSVSSGKRSKLSWRSLPSLVMQLSAKLVAERQNQHHHHHHNSNSNHDSRRIKESSQIVLDTCSLSRENNNNEDGYIDVDNGLDNPSSESSNQDNAGFESLVFDMSNRAKLPKGIQDIRPHLENIDNIPLQVSLFTDCKPDLTKEMIEIMQDYGEIVCVLGSSSSALNTPIFLQANASIAIEPLETHTCMRSADDPGQTTSSRRAAGKRRHQQREANRQRRHQDSEALAEQQRQQTRNAKMVRGLPASGHETAASGLPANVARSNKPRDRLGINSASEPAKPVKVIPLRQVTEDPDTIGSTSSTSSMSSSSATSRSDSSSSFDSSSEDEGEQVLGGDDLVGEELSCLMDELPNANALASKLASLPCCYSYNRKDHVNLYSLIMEARHFTFKMKNTFVCMICFALSISSAQFLASLLFLPPMLSSGLTIWLTIVVVPLMSFALMSTTMDTQVMKIAVGKNLQLKPQNITFFVICYLIKFIPSIIVVVLSFGLIIAHSCKLTGFGSSSLGPCWMFTYVQHGNATNSNGPGDLLWSAHLYTAQVCAAFLMVLYFVVISSGFVHRSHLMWQRSPTKNRLWVLISFGLLIGQLFYNRLILEVNLNSSEIPYDFLASLPPHIWLISFIWPFIAISINLLVKRAEIKATIRQQRRARFDFNTKLGMNSPF